MIELYIAQIIGMLGLGVLVYILVLYLSQYVSLFFYPKWMGFRFFTDETSIKKYLSAEKIRNLSQKLEQIGYESLGLFSEETPFRNEVSLTYSSSENNSFASLYKFKKKVYSTFTTPFIDGGRLITTNAALPKTKGENCLVEAFSNANLQELKKLHDERLAYFVSQGVQLYETYDQDLKIEETRKFYASRSTKKSLAYLPVKVLFKLISVIIGVVIGAGIVYLLIRYYY